MSEQNPTLTTIISGSFRKHLVQIMKLKSELEASGVIVLSPAGQSAINPEDQFIILDSDPISDPKILQDSVFAKMRRSPFIVLANVNGYIGKAAALEMGYAIAYGIDILTLEDITDPNLKPYCRPLEDAFPGVYYSYMESVRDEELSEKGHN